MGPEVRVGRPAPGDDVDGPILGIRECLLQVGTELVEERDDPPLRLVAPDDDSGPFQVDVLPAEFKRLRRAAEPPAAAQGENPGWATTGRVANFYRTKGWGREVCPIGR